MHATLTKRMWWPFAITTLLGAFLVFQVQPIISKTVLPWYGGSPAVWTTCMLFFQVLLFGGYLYAHLLTRMFTSRGQGLVHVCVLSAAVLLLPINPSATCKPTSSDHPVAHLLWLLCAHVGAPYFALASTGPLTQAWFARFQNNERVYRLYALSNFGSLAALVSYPFVVEPFFTTFKQSTSWSVLFCGFALIQGLLAIRLMRVDVSRESQSGAFVGQRNQGVVPSEPPTPTRRLAWLVFPAFASIMLLAVTNHVSQEVAVIPFLWIVPLSLYLLTFIICFDRPAWYRAKWTSALSILTLFALPLASHGPFQGVLLLELALYLSLLFFVCMLCHGELARLKPEARYLTHYYLMLSAGGALGGLIVALLCPQLFATYFELPIALALSAGFALILFVSHKRWDDSRFEWNRAKRFSIAVSALVLALIVLRGMKANDGAMASARNFFGVLKVAKFGPHRAMLHGQTVHGLQLPSPRERTPTTYYSEQAGLGRVMESFAQRPALKIGAVGLGVGTLAVYGRPDDEIEFIEINPAVTRMAEQYFDFMKSSPARVHVLHGDGRLVLEKQINQSAQKYDLLVLDAFSSDAIPAHMLTIEAMQIYRARIKSDGVLVFHVTNRHLRLAPIVHRLAKELDWHSLELKTKGDPSVASIDAHWVMVAADPQAFEHPALNRFQKPLESDVLHAPLWTDQYHDLLRVFEL